jgi:type IV secretory pathway VirB2 component (pilin)
MFKGNFSGAALTALIFVSLAMFADAALASTAGPGGGSGLQWENPLQMIVRSISGPVAYTFGVVALVAFTIGWAFGDEMSGALRKLLNIVIGIAGLMFAVPLIGSLFVGAVIP